MFSQSTLVALLAAPLAANAHYIFSRLIVNGEAIGGDYAHVRQNTNSYMPSFTDDIINSEDLRCNAGAGGVATETYDVVAGDTVGFKLFNDEFIEHPGPGFIYMSLADGDVSSYDGSGDWFKVWESGLNGPAGPGHETNWGTYNADTMEFTIPTDLPDGEYLVRPEHIAIHEGHVGKAQFYMECAQLRVSGGGSGVPGPTVKIPGLYTPEEVNFDMWTSPEPTSYTMPGPAVWIGGGSSSGGAPSTGNTTETTTPEEVVPEVPSAAPVASAAPVYSAPAAVSSPPAWGAQPAWGAAPTTMATVIAAAVPSVAPVQQGDCGVVYV